MLLAALSSLVASVMVPTLAAQVPLGRDQRLANFDDRDPTRWRLNDIPNPNTTDNFVFETVFSLLRTLPNNRMKYGHNIVPGSIPKGTTFYHVTRHEGGPSSPEWVALDPEHAYSFCVQPSCWELTFATTRPLKVVYFDGKSASKLPFGPLDVQDFLAWGELHPEYAWEEMKRIEDLCEWGKNVSVDGFVRMEMSFEVIICDFTSGVKLVSSTNMVPSYGIPSDTVNRSVFEAIYSGSWHSRFPGETRIQLDLPGLVSFYDTQLVPSLVPIRAGQERRYHRAGNASSEDVSAVVSRLEAALTRPSGLSSGIDWRTLIQVIIDRYAERLELTQHLLNSSATIPEEIIDLADKTQTQLRVMLTPYLPFSVTPTDPSDKAALDWTAPIYKLCATTYTALIEFELDSMTDSEKLLLRAVQGTSREICRVVIKMWAAGVYAGIDGSANRKESLDIVEITRLLDAWGEDLNQLMEWLGWAVWVKCNPACGPEELCLLHEWPIWFPIYGTSRGMVVEIAEDVQTTVIPRFGEVLEPKCVSRVDP